MIFDTDVLVWVLRDHARAVRLLDAAKDRHLSVVTYMELLRGARDRREIRAVQDFLDDSAFHVLPLGENVGHRASVYMETYSLGSGLSVTDALIAATAVENHLTLCTSNRKHFKPINDLDLKVFRP